MSHGLIQAPIGTDFTAYTFDFQTFKQSLKDDTRQAAATDQEPY
jgi:hypothetical protein